MKHLLSVALLLGMIPFAQAPASPSLPPWSAGTLDIHQLSTGEGNAALIVMPDGTSLLLDAGAAGDHRAGDRIADYLQQRGVARLDYVLLTHYHGDHIGGVFDVAGRLP